MTEQTTAEPPIVEVWRNNLDEEFEEIMKIIDTHTVIGMDTEFPGEVFAPRYSPSRNTQYDKVKLNVDQLSLIQLGLTFATPSNAPKKSTRTWQFNFHFCPEVEYYSEESIKLLRTAGINFERHKTDGIDAHLFGEYLTTSGIVCNEKMTWTTFHASYDFGYLLKVLTNTKLPRTESDFLAEMKLFFPVVYDLKIITQTKQGLNKLADDYKIRRHGIMHQAGSDSLLTVETFQTYVDTVLNGTVDDQYLNQIAGLKSDYIYNLDLFSVSGGRGNYKPFHNIFISNTAHVPMGTGDQVRPTQTLMPPTMNSINPPYQSMTALYAPTTSLTGSQPQPPPSMGPAGHHSPSQGDISREIYFPVTAAGSPSPAGPAPDLTYPRNYPLPYPMFPFPMGGTPNVTGIAGSGPIMAQGTEHDLNSPVGGFTPGLGPPDLSGSQRSAGQHSMMSASPSPIPSWKTR